MRRLNLFVDFLNCLFTASQCSFQYLSVLCHKWSMCYITGFSRLIILMIVPFSSGSVDTHVHSLDELDLLMTLIVGNLLTEAVAGGANLPAGGDHPANLQGSRPSTIVSTVWAIC